MNEFKNDLNLRVEIQIRENQEGEEFEVFWNEVLSHSFSLELVQPILKKTKEELWKKEETSGRSIGVSLFDLINGSAGRRGFGRRGFGRRGFGRRGFGRRGFGRRGLGKLDAVLKESYQKGCRLLLYLDLPASLDPLPFELLCSSTSLESTTPESTAAQGFLLLQSHIQILRLVMDRNRQQEQTPEKASLQILFMACSPTDLPDDKILSFEETDGSPEEELILQEAEDLQLHLSIEDSGNPKLLEKKLIQDRGYDLIHITGHAGEMELMDQTGAMRDIPIFHMETETGGMFNTTPQILWESLEAFPPRLLFLSGCSTGKSKPTEQMQSFAQQMVQRGIPWVLGWGLPVGDRGATRFAAQIYQSLSMGKDLADAVQWARKDLASRCLALATFDRHLNKEDKFSNSPQTSTEHLQIFGEKSSQGVRIRIHRTTTRITTGLASLARESGTIRSVNHGSCGCGEILSLREMDRADHAFIFSPTSRQEIDRLAWRTPMDHPDLKTA